MTGCNVCVRGVFAEPNKKPTLGQKRLHLYIQGTNKNEVASAYKEIKRLLDENALMHYTMGSQSGYTGGQSRYQV